MPIVVTSRQRVDFLGVKFTDLHFYSLEFYLADVNHNIVISGGGGVYFDILMIEDTLLPPLKM